MILVKLDVAGSVVIGVGISCTLEVLTEIMFERVW
jgi:hypothetical protein